MSRGALFGSSEILVFGITQLKATCIFDKIVTKSLF